MIAGGVVVTGMAVVVAVELRFEERSVREGGDGAADSLFRDDRERAGVGDDGCGLGLSAVMPRRVATGVVRITVGTFIGVSSSTSKLLIITGLSSSVKQQHE